MFRAYDTLWEEATMKLRVAYRTRFAERIIVKPRILTPTPGRIAALYRYANELCMVMYGYQYFWYSDSDDSVEFLKDSAGRISVIIAHATESGYMPELAKVIRLLARNPAALIVVCHPKQARETCRQIHCDSIGRQIYGDWEGRTLTKIYNTDASEKRVILKVYRSPC